ncbi:hypothetical protein PA25_21920 [Pseudoalteromonas sp. A25]|uniref:hypothetical protein n=1 Tax=Pseudoalteromonas sp. A25 TaxID=116092 RepID=UPI001260758D|nr:hypothetical protein [Pseudoalteromonas sp. A25]BBN82207.1 hypothetical protein PA25_21920 [Pseudoalteromonas sp. A25]
MIKRIFTFILLSLSISSSAFYSTNRILYLNLTSSEETISIEAKLDGKTKKFRLDEDSNITKRNFKSILEKLNEWELSKKYFENNLAHYEKTIFNPISTMLDESNQVHFILDEGSFAFALDLIPYKGKPLFLQRPTSFSSKPIRVVKNYKFNPDGLGLTIKDKTTDPESASLILSKIMPNTVNYNMESISKDQLAQLSNLDMALISLHGIASDGVAFMQLNDEEVYSYDLAQLNSRLLYLDSCQIGSSFNFAEQVSKSANQFIIAPLFDNEAGDSSTLTIQSFFTQLNNGSTPANAMYHTRKSLFEGYNNTYGFKTAIWKAYPFRVIQSN